MADNTLNVVVAQYTRSRFYGNKKLPYAWVIALVNELNEGPVYQLSGTPPDSKYLGPYNVNDITESGAYRGHVVLGTVNANQVDQIGTIMSSLIIYNDRSDWNCQNWVLSGLRRLQSAGFIGGETFTFESLTDTLLQAENDVSED